MMKKFLFLLIICVGFSCQKQHEKNNTKEQHEIPTPPPPKIIDERALIGFACFYEGSSSNSVKKISEILKNKNYTILKTKLYDENSAEKYLATVACEKLEKKNLIKLTEKEFVQIKINKTSTEKVTICSGCTNEEKLTLKDMFSSEENFLSDSVEKWINEMIR